MKLSAVSMTSPVFKGYDYVTNNLGANCYRFNYPHDASGEKCQVEIYGVAVNENGETTVVQKDGKPYGTFDVPVQGGVAIDVGALGIGPKERFAYQYKIYSGDHVRSMHDFGPKTKDNNYNTVYNSSLKPRTSGGGYLIMPDSFAVGYKYNGLYDVSDKKHPKPNAADTITNIVFDEKIQEEAVNARRTFTNNYGGNLAGVMAKIPYLKSMGITNVFSTPITGGDSLSPFFYWPENMFQLSRGIGEMPMFEDLMNELYANGMRFILDVPLTSEGWQGIHYQYALKWADTDTQMKRWFRMEGIENEQVGYGIAGYNSENLSHYLVNSPVSFELKDGKYVSVPNFAYDEKLPTSIQYFDKAYVSEEQLKYKDIIQKYDKVSIDNPLATVTHDDTPVRFHHILTDTDFDTYLKNVEKLNEINRIQGKDIRLDSKEGTMFVSNLSNTRTTEKAAGGVVTWDANTDMIKYRYFDSAYDYKSSGHPVDENGMTAENCQLQDMAIKAMQYFPKKAREYNLLYTAKQLGNVQNAAEGRQKIEQLVKNGKLPKESTLDIEALQNIDEGWYNLDSPEFCTDTLLDKTLMGLHLESLELSRDTLGVLSTPYFTDRATSSDLIGLSRYELSQKGNPQFPDYINERYGYKDVYERVNKLYTGPIKRFAKKVLEQVDEALPNNRLFTDKSKDTLTEYGYYVVSLLGEDIAKFAFMRDFVPEVPVVANSKGQIFYDTDYSRKNSSLKTLDIVAHTPEYEAQLLIEKMENSIFSLDYSQVKFMADSILARLKDTNINSFRYAEAMVKKSGLGPGLRIDALKDYEDQDAIRNKKDLNAKVWNNLQNFFKTAKDKLAEINPSMLVISEITDSGLLDGDGIITSKDFIYNSETVSEAGYNFFFTEILKILCGDPARDCDKGTASGLYSDGPYPNGEYKEKLVGEIIKNLLEKDFSVDYVRNLYNFGDNHDKPRLPHCMAVDLSLYNCDLNASTSPHRMTALRMLTGAASNNELPFDVIYNMNTDGGEYINKNYFIGASTYAIATGDIIRSKLSSVMSNPDDVKKLHEAVTALVNGYYSEEPQERPTYIDYNTAFDEVLDIAVDQKGLELSADVRSELSDAVYKESREIVDRIITYNEGGVEKVDYNRLRNYGRSFELKEGDEAQIVVLANILKEAVEKKLGDLNNYYANSTNNKYVNYTEMLSKINEALSTYISKYDHEKFQNNNLEQQLYQLGRKGNERNAFGVSDIRESIRLVFAKAGLADDTEAQFKLFKLINDPAMAKVRMYMRILASLPGIPQLYGGDELSMSGYEEKSKNLWLQNRNALTWWKVDENDQSEEANYYREVQQGLVDIMNLRAPDGALSILNTGSPYLLNNIGNVPAILTTDSDGSVAVSLFNTKDVGSLNPNPTPVEINEISLKTPISVCSANSQGNYIYSLALTAGLVLKNVLSQDGSLYKVVKEGQDYYIRRFSELNGERLSIYLDNKIMKDGVFTIYNKVKNSKIHFKGNSTKSYYNQQYHIVSNPNYFMDEKQPICGQKLSLIAK